MVDVAALAALLAPALPYLTQAGERAASEASRALGDETWKYAKRLWDKLAGAISRRPAAREAVDDVAAAADDAEARVALVRQLRKLLEADPGLARDVEQLLGEATRAGVVSSGARSIALGGSATNSIIITGDSVTVDRD